METNINPERSVRLRMCLCSVNFERAEGRGLTFKFTCHFTVALCASSGQFIIPRLTIMVVRDCLKNLKCEVSHDYFQSVNSRNFYRRHSVPLYIGAEVDKRFSKAKKTLKKKKKQYTKVLDIHIL